MWKENKTEYDRMTPEEKRDFHQFALAAAIAFVVLVGLLVFSH
jgi:hypothetical protein